MSAFPTEARDDTRDGFIAALICYLIWGLLPIYFVFVSAVAPLEVLLHRIVWAVPFGALIIFSRRQWPEVRRALTHPAMLFWLAVAAMFIAINWYVYIYAIQNNQIFQGSLGYYINPLVYVVIGVVFLGERLRSLQIAAVGIATIGVLVLTFSGGQFPTIALTLAFSFSVYGVIRKRIVIGAMPGLFVETILLLPIAMAWLGWMIYTGRSAFGSEGVGITTLLVLAGPITVVPLLFFALAARRLPLSTIGFMQFLAPTLQFCVGLYYGEKLSVAHMICFACIWAAVILFSTDALRAGKKKLQPA
ncbi:MAG: EamA family transporter RarD [Woeseiaceae bacterium]|nr:EamA family transporter RarD [Woeseiaceae bacterium]